MNKNDLLNLFTNPQPIPSSFNEGFSQYETIKYMIGLTNQLINNQNLGADEIEDLKRKKVALEYYLDDLKNKRKLDENGNFTGTWQGFKPSQVDVAISSIIEKHNSQFNSMFVNVLYPPNNLLPCIPDCDYVAKIGTDNTDRFQAIIDYVMNNGGGTIYIPSGSYLINGTLYTHNVGITGSPKTPLKICGAFPSSVMPKEVNNTKLVKLNGGVILGTNYNTVDNTVIKYPDVYTYVTIENIQFRGDGVLDPKYPQLANTKGAIGIEMHLTRIHISNCSFYGLEYGIYQPTFEGSDDNYCDKSTYKHLVFSNIGMGCINIIHGDNSLIEDITINTLANAKYGIKLKGCDSIRITEVLSAGGWLNTQLNILYIENSHNISLDNMYLENLANTPIYVLNSSNTNIDRVYLRHRAPTYGVTVLFGSGCNNISISNIYYLAVDGQRLDTINDTGNFTVYNTVATPNDFDLSYSTNVIKKNIVMVNATYVNGILTSNGARDLRISTTTIWTGSGRTSTVTIASSNSSDSNKKSADYVCTGINDEVIIQRALYNLNTSGTGGKVILLEGTYNINATIYVYSNTILEGQGNSTILKVINGATGVIYVLSNSQTTDSNITIKNILIDGNKSNNGTTDIRGIYCNYGSKFLIENVTIQSTYKFGIQLNNTSNSVIEKCNISATGLTSGIYATKIVNVNISKNNIYSCYDVGISINDASTNNIISGNYCYQNGTHGISIGDTSSNNIIQSNMCYANSQNVDNVSSGIILSGSASYNNIQLNTSRQGSLLNGHKFGITISASGCNGNFVSNNDLYTGGKTSNFYDGGSSTVTTSGNRI
jgi:hypothetical protein